MEVDALPSERVELRARLLSSLSASPPPREQWEVGGSTNFMIAAARLGLSVHAFGHVADDEFGDFLRTCLAVCP